MSYTLSISFSKSLFLAILLICGFACFAADDAITLQVLSAEELQVQVEDIQSTAQQYVNEPNIPQAVEEYRKIQKMVPTSAYALDAQDRVIRLYLKNGQPGDAKVALNQLKQNYSTQPEYVRKAHELGWEFRKKGDDATALQIYKDLKQQFPGHELGAKIQRSIIGTYLQKGDTANVAKAVEEMKTHFKNSPDYIHQVEYVSDRLTEKGLHGLAKGMCESLLEQYPGHDGEIWFLQKKIRAELGLGSEAVADAEVAVIHQKYANHKDYHDALSWTAYEYRTYGYYDKAITMYQDLYDKNPDKKVQLRCDEGIARCNVRLGNEPKVQEQIDRIYSNYTDNLSGVTFYMYGIGEEYYKMAQDAETTGDPNQLSTKYYGQAIEVWKRQLAELPAYYNANFVYYLAVSLARTGDYTQAINYYQQLVDQWPDYEEAWDAQHMIADCYEKLTASGRMDLKTAQEQSKAAYQKVIDNYATSPAVKVAQRKLAKMEQE